MKKNCSIVFTGDIGFDRYMDKRWEDENLLDKSIIDFCNSGDHTIANVEGAMIKAEDDGSRGVFFHSMNPEARIVLEKIHANIWNIANNHIMDAGKDGLLSTIEHTESINVKTVGAGVNENEASKPVFIDEAGGIGIIAVAYQKECIPATDKDPGVFRWDDEVLIEKLIKEIKNKCKWCIVISHGGEEFADLPNPYTRNRYLKFLEMGADVVVGHHPHVVENYELFENGKMIFYSLGNFIFDTDYQRVHMYTEYGVLLKLILDEEKVHFEAMATRINRDNETVEECEMIDIFTDINKEEYELISPLASYSFIREDMKKMIYLEKEKYENASEDVWNSYFYSEEPDGYDKGKHMDLSVVVPHALKVKEERFKESKLKKAVKYILDRNNY